MPGTAASTEKVLRNICWMKPLALPAPASIVHKHVSNQLMRNVQWRKVPHAKNPRKVSILFTKSAVFPFSSLWIRVSVQSLSHVRLFATPWTAACQASLPITNSCSLFKLMSIKLMMPSNHLILCHLLIFLPSIFPNYGVFSNESVLHIRWPKYWSFSFNISPSNECSGTVWSCSPRDSQEFSLEKEVWASSKAPIFWRSAFFIVQLRKVMTNPDTY